MAVADAPQHLSAMTRDTTPATTPAVNASDTTLHLYLDLVDPLSFHLNESVRTVEAEDGVRVERIIVELRPPPAPLTDTDDPFWAGRWSEADSISVTGNPRPCLVPSSRKAHELVLHAREAGADVGELIQRLASAFTESGADTGRVDILVGIATGLGMDLTETKAVLDVDRFEAEAALAADRHARLGVSVPALVCGDQRLEGFHNVAAIRTFLG